MSPVQEQPLSPTALLSIDVDAHLKKLAANTFGSKYHYPVELVRLSLQRGADLVEVKLKPDRVEIRDNGRGITKKELELLRELPAPNRPVRERELAIESLKIPPGIGLLAIFSPAYSRILIENATGEDKRTLLIEGRKVKESSSCSLESGTRIAIFRKGDNINKEKSILLDYCRAVPEEIILNGKALEKKHLLTPPPMVSLRIPCESMLKKQTFSSILSGKEFPVPSWAAGATRTLKLEASPHIGDGVVGVPLKGDLCKIWLLDQGIPYYHTSIRPYKGFIFSAAVEFQGEVNKDLLNRLTEPVTRLYYWMAQRYEGYPESYRERVEELLFKHYRVSADNKMINCFSPFKVLNSPARLSLSQVTRKAAAGVLYAVPENENTKRYDTGGAVTLSLSRNQVDFLINHLGIPLSFHAPVKHRHHYSGIFHKLIKKLKYIISRMLTAGKKIIDSSELNPEEAPFIDDVGRYLSARSTEFDGLLPGIEIETAIINARGLNPGVMKPPLLLINRKHPLVRKAIRAHQQDPRSIEFAVYLFL